MPEPAGHHCLLAFDSPDAEFARGFEAGRIWDRLRAEPTEVIVETIHASNAEMVLRMAEATDRRVQAVELDGTWLEATFDAERC